MGVDLHRIGTGISSGKSRNGFGNIVSFPSVPAGFPAAGTILSTQYLLKPINDGGSYVSDPNGGQYANAMHTVYQIADGSGGSYLDWATSVFANYITGGFFTENGSTYLMINGVQYSNGSYSNTYEHDGYGGISYSGGSSYNSNGETIVSIVGNQTLTYYDEFTGLTTVYVWQTFDTYYYHDGSGGYYSTNLNVNTQPAGALIQSGVIDLDGDVYANPVELAGEVLNLNYFTYDIVHDGNGSYYANNTQSQTYPYGNPLPCSVYGSQPYPYHILVADAGAGYDFGILHDGSFREFLADGTNGYYVTMHTASYFAAETPIGSSPNGVVKWDGNGGFYEDTN